LYKVLKQMPLSLFEEKYNIISQKVPQINGTAIFLVKSIDPLPSYVAQTIFSNNIIYEENILVRVITLKTPFGSTAVFKDDLAKGLRVFEIRMGYLEITDIEKIIYAADIHPRVIFYGVEDIATKNPFWRIFTVIKKLTPSFVQFYKLPSAKLHGVVAQVKM
jgi:KUP system potassium uptake protein